MSQTSPVPTHRATIGRRTFLHTTAAAATIASTTLLASCGTPITQIVTGQPTPDPLLTPLRDQLRAISENNAATGNSALATFYARQADAVDIEHSRQCGVDDNGNPPENCRNSSTNQTSQNQPTPHSTDTNTADTDATYTAEAHYLSILTQTADDVEHPIAHQLPGEQLTLAGLYAAFCITQPNAQWNAIETIDRAALLPELQKMANTNATTIDGAAPAREQLHTLLTLCYESLYASGLTLAADDGTFRPAITTTANRIRTLRNDLLTALNDTPTPDAGYQLPGDGQRPATPNEAADLYWATLRPITQQLRSLTAAAGGGVSGEFFARWTGITARGEAALERGLGRDPLANIIRGNEN